MKRRNFLSRIFGSAVAVAAAPVIVKAIEPRTTTIAGTSPITYSYDTGTIYTFIDGQWLPLRASPCGAMLKVVDGVPHWLGTTT